MGKLIDNRYDIIQKIGEGGMGAVYLAQDTRLERKVAIKRLHLIARQEDLQIFHQRFEREAKVMARFQHPNIVSVYDYGTDDEGIYLVLEYMPGGSLAQRMRQQGFSVEESIAVLLPLCDALTAIHQRGSVHRDLKPANILFDEYSNPKLADFGVVKLLQGQDLTFTPTGAAVGTPAYMAPELIGGEASPSTDQYALGVMLYELVTGKKPFKGRTPMETLTMQKYEPLPDPRSSNPELPGWICAVICKALAKEASGRYADINALAAALRAGEPQEDATEIAMPAVESDCTILQAGRARFAEEGETQDILPAQAAAIVHQPIKYEPAPKKKMPNWLPWGIAAGVLGIVGIVFLIRWISGLAEPAEPTEAALPVAQADSTETAAATVTETLQPTQTLTSTAIEATKLYKDMAISPDNAMSIQELFRIDVGSNGGDGIGFAPSGNSFIVTSGVGIRVYDVVNFGKTNTITDDHISSVAYSPTGEIIAAGVRPSNIRLWDASSGELLRTLSDNFDNVHTVTFSPDGEILASGGGDISGRGDNIIRLWDVATGSLIHRLVGHTDIVFDLTFSPDGAIVASGGGDGKIKIWATDTGELEYTLEGHTSSVFGIAFSPDGSILVSGGYDKTIRIWDLESREQIYIISPETNIYDIVFSPDGRIFATGGLEDKSVQIWDAESYELLNTLTGHTSYVTMVAFSPNGSILISASHHCDPIIWGFLRDSR